MCHWIIIIKKLGVILMNVIRLNKREKRKEKFIKENYVKWNDEGNYFREERKKRGLSIKYVAEKLNTSASRIRRLEVGEPVQQAEHLKAVYQMLFDYVDLHKDLFDLWEKHV